MLSLEAAQTLLAHGWKQEGETFTWTSDHGTRLVLTKPGAKVELRLYLLKDRALSYEIDVEQARESELISVVVQHTEQLGRLQHDSFSEAVTHVTEDVLVETTEGAIVRPRTGEHGLVWDPVKTKR